MRRYWYRWKAFEKVDYQTDNIFHYQATTDKINQIYSTYYCQFGKHQDHFLSRRTEIGGTALGSQDGTTTELVRHANWKPLLFRWGIRLNSSPLVIGAIKTIKGFSLVGISIRVTYDAYVTNWTLVGPSAFLPAICYWTPFYTGWKQVVEVIKIYHIYLAVDGDQVYSYMTLILRCYLNQVVYS
ncbi:hypothetical protein BCR42DRAFT_496564 [Absidia repens]|uniref:Uncharacterized protein n=1 Tax=Absidia repens TaxID=90262 RepID=A0A1X2HZ78_9FUNG|nr:hypothetical protein BCR42DRAFT_496564 [Absidia repens]